MLNNNIVKFYKEALDSNKFGYDFIQELRNISNKADLEKFIQEKVCPIAKSMGYDFTVDELISYEIEATKNLSEEELESITGGTGVNHMVLGGVVALFVIGGGTLLSGTAHAELSKDMIALSSDIATAEFENDIPTPKMPSQKATVDDKKSTQPTTPTVQTATSNTEQDKTSEVPSTDSLKDKTKQMSQTSDETKTASKESKPTSSAVADLKTMQKIVDVKANTEPTIKSKKLTEKQELYTLQALNLPDAYALLQSNVIEKLRLFGNISEITLDENGNRRYTADKGDAFTELLYMLYPSPAGDLNTNTTFKGRDNFAMYGGVSSDLMAKFCATLNDYRNGKIEIPKRFNTFTKKEMVGANEVNILDDDFLNAVKWMEQKNILPNGPDNKLSDKLEEINRNKNELKEINLELQTIADKLKAAKKDKTIDSAQLLSWQKKIKDYSAAINKIIKNNKECQKAKAYFSFINVLKESVDLENQKESPYPQYLTEHILMSYMIKTLNTEDDVKKLYHNITEQFTQNETNKTSFSEDEKAEIAKKIESEKAKIATLNEIINAAEIQKLSPYKSETQANDLAYQIGTPDKDGNISISNEEFADCADTTVRHTINLLTYSNDKNWDLILPQDPAKLEELNEKSKKVITAINEKKQVEFYDLKTRLQMFFLYQRGLTETDSEENAPYRSPNKADDVTSLARTLWEYVICNMDHKDHFAKDDKDKDFYTIVYTKRGTNHELKTGYINMLKLMWNIAYALNSDDKSVDVNTNLSLAKENINVLVEKTEYDEELFNKTINSIFSLFHPNSELKYEFSKCKYEKILENNELTGDITVNIIHDDAKLNFMIHQANGHAYVEHSPIIFDVYKSVEQRYKDKSNLEKLKKLKAISYYKISPEDKALRKKLENEFDEKLAQQVDNDFAKLLFNKFTNNDKFIPQNELYRAFLANDLIEDDPFRNTNFYKKYKALSALKTLQGEENNIYRMMITITAEVMEGAKEIQVTQIIKDSHNKNKKVTKTLAELFCEKYLLPNYNEIDDSLYELLYKYGNLESSSIGKFIRTGKENQVVLLINNPPENLTIPSTFLDENNNELKVIAVKRASTDYFSTLKKVTFTGEFDNLEILSNTFLRSSLEEVSFECNAKNLTIGSEALAISQKLKTLKISGHFDNITFKESSSRHCHSLKSIQLENCHIANLIIEKDAFWGCDKLEEFTIKNCHITNFVLNELALKDTDKLKKFAIKATNVTIVTIGKLIFSNCTASKILTISPSVQSLNIDSDMSSESTIKYLYIPQHLRTKLSRDFKDNDKIVFYDISSTIVDGHLKLKVNAPVDNITLTKEMLEAFSKQAGSTAISDIHTIQAKDLDDQVIEVELDEILNSEFEKSGEVYVRKASV